MTGDHPHDTGETVEYLMHFPKEKGDYSVSVKFKSKQNYAPFISVRSSNLKLIFEYIESIDSGSIPTFDEYPAIIISLNINVKRKKFLINADVL